MPIDSEMVWGCMAPGHVSDKLPASLTHWLLYFGGLPFSFSVFLWGGSTATGMYKPWASCPIQQYHIRIIPLYILYYGALKEGGVPRPLL